MKGLLKVFLLNLALYHVSSSTELDDLGGYNLRYIIINTLYLSIKPLIQLRHLIHALMCGQTGYSA